MISPREAHALTTHNKVQEEFELKVDDAIRGACAANQWPCVVTCGGAHGQYAEVVAGKYRAIGWVVSVQHSYLPLTFAGESFLQFERPTP